MNTVYDQAFGAKMPTYSTVLQLDRKLRAFPVPPLLQIAGFGSTDSRAGGTTYESVPLILQRHVVLAVRESSESTNPNPKSTLFRFLGSLLWVAWVIGPWHYLVSEPLFRYRSGHCLIQFMPRPFPYHTTLPFPSFLGVCLYGENLPL